MFSVALSNLQPPVKREKYDGANVKLTTCILDQFFFNPCLILQFINSDEVTRFLSTFTNKTNDCLRNTFFRRGKANEIVRCVRQNISRTAKRDSHQHR